MKYINATELYRHLSDMQLKDYSTQEAGKEYELISRILQAIEKKPPADVRENIRGEWIPDDYAYYHCSKCGFEYEYQEYITLYCPQCGARMEDE